MNKKFFVLLCSVVFTAERSAQDYLEKKSRFRFAQTYVGLDFLYFPGFSGLNRIYEPSDAQKSIPDSFSPRVTIGGLHFWGYADFYVSFPVYNNIFTQAVNTGGIHLYSGIETGFHFYPWQLKYNSLRPFIGISWIAFGFRQNFENGSQGSSRSLHRFPIIAGLSYQNTWGQIDLTARYALNPTFEYYITPEKRKEYKPAPFSLGLGYKYIFDTSRRVEDNLQAVKEREERLKKADKLSGISLGIGPSAAITVRKFETTLKDRSFLNTRPRIALAPDATVGYHIYDIDSEVRFAYRFMRQTQDGFGLEQTFTRHALSLEFIKFLLDYQGFVPFIGLGVEFNRLSYQESGNAALRVSNSRFGLPIVFGWDIRPVISASWLLRTTLRYNPLPHLRAEGNRVPFEHFEFNFIQFVYYLNR